jgi:Fe-S cluster biogenesis protein NfuA
MERSLQCFVRVFVQAKRPTAPGGHTMQEKVKEVLDKIRPSLQADGGDVELVAVENGIVKVRLKGACAGCPMSQMTLKNGIEKLLKREVPEVIAVEGV